MRDAERQIKLHHPLRGGRDGRRCSQRHAFPRHREMARRWKSWWVEVEKSNRLAHWAIAFPNAPDNVDGVIGQTAQGLCHNGNEVYPCRTAVWQVCGQLALGTDMQGVARGGSGLVQSELLKWWNHMYVQCGWTAVTPGGEENDSRLWLWGGHHTNSFPCRGQSGGLGGGEENVTCDYDVWLYMVVWR